jgi:hypothetical protein
MKLNHKGPYKITFVANGTGKTYSFTRKTFQAAENVAAFMFNRIKFASIAITNSEGMVHSRLNKTPEAQS